MKKLVLILLIAFLSILSQETGLIEDIRDRGTLYEIEMIETLL